MSKKEVEELIVFLKEAYKDIEDRDRLMDKLGSTTAKCIKHLKTQSDEITELKDEISDLKDELYRKDSKLRLLKEAVEVCGE